MAASLKVVVFDSAWRTRFSTLGDSGEAFLSALRDHAQGEARGRRLWTMNHGGRTYIALSATSTEGTLLLLHEEPEETPLLDFVLTVDIAFDILDHFLTNPYESITVVDKNALLRYISPVHERFFGFERGTALGRPVQEVIENTRLHVVARSGHAEIGQVQDMRGVTRVVNRIPIFRDGELVGAIGRVMFKAPEEVHELSRQISSLRAEVDYYKKELAGLRHRSFGLDEIVGESEPMRQLKADIRKVAPLDVPVFLSGESGTGKELVAHAIHNLSRRFDKPMVVVNCGALPANLVESELFGYEGGAFTGARRGGHSGKFEMADRSSLFLDEIGDMPLEIQVKLLRVLETGVFERVGSNQSRHANLRLISATNRDLRRMITEDAFRADLYFRINGVTLFVPPLRERKNDIPLLVRHFIHRIGPRIGSTIRSIQPKALELLQTLNWPGNVRQLYHEVQKAMIFAEGPALTFADFRDLDGMPGAASKREAPVVLGSSAEGPSMRETMENVELTLIREALQRHRGNKKRVAEELGISRSYLYKKLEGITGVR